MVLQWMRVTWIMKKATAFLSVMAQILMLKTM